MSVVQESERHLIKGGRKECFDKFENEQRVVWEGLLEVSTKAPS